MANKVSDAKQKKMFQAYCEKQSIEYVARKCKVTSKTCRRYRDKYDWVKRLQAINKKQAGLEDSKLAKKRAKANEENIKIIEDLKKKFKKAVKDGDFEFSKIDKAIDNLIRLENYVLGGYDKVSKVDLQNGNISVSFGDIDDS